MHSAHVAAFWYLRSEEIDREVESVKRDAELVQQQVRLRLIENQEQLVRLARELGDLAGKLVVHPAGKIFRVQLGPWPDAAAAQLASARLRDTLGMNPVVVQR